MNGRSRTADEKIYRDPSSVRATGKRVPGPVANEDADERARELMTMAADDLRSPLTAIKIVRAALERRWRTGGRPTGAEWAAAVSRISRLVDSASSLINDLLAIERLDYPFKPAATQRPIDVEKLIHEAIVYQRKLDGARSDVTVFVHRRVDRARGSWDRVYLLRVLSNLLGNASQARAGSADSHTLARRRDDAHRVLRPRPWPVCRQ